VKLESIIVLINVCSFEYEG